MADETKSTASAPKPSAAEKSSSSSSAASTPASPDNGKGDAPRNCFSDKFRSNFDGIDWSK